MKKILSAKAKKEFYEFWTERMQATIRDSKKMLTGPVFAPQLAAMSKLIGSEQVKKFTDVMLECIEVGATLDPPLAPTEIVHFLSQSIGICVHKMERAAYEKVVKSTKMN